VVAVQLVFLGAISGIVRQRGISGSVPGAVLALALLSAAYGRLFVHDSGLDVWTELSILAVGISQFLFVGVPRRRAFRVMAPVLPAAVSLFAALLRFILVNLPLDFRLTLVVTIGFLVRADIWLVSDLIRQ
jgi:hypothetical protein